MNPRPGAWFGQAEEHPELARGIAVWWYRSMAVMRLSRWAVDAHLLSVSERWLMAVRKLPCSPVATRSLSVLVRLSLVPGWLLSVLGCLEVLLGCLEVLGRWTLALGRLEVLLGYLVVRQECPAVLSGSLMSTAIQVLCRPVTACLLPGMAQSRQVVQLIAERPAGQRSVAAVSVLKWV